MKSRTTTTYEFTLAELLRAALSREATQDGVDITEARIVIEGCHDSPRLAPAAVIQVTVVEGDNLSRRAPRSRASRSGVE